jgi:hypothetical protein
VKIRPRSYNVVMPPPEPTLQEILEARLCTSSPGGELLLGLRHSTVFLGEPQSSELVVGDTSGVFNLDEPLAAVDWNDVSPRGVHYGLIGEPTPEVSANTIWRAVPWPNGSNSGGTSTLRVWDWREDVLYQYDAPSGRRIVGPSYAAGRFWWLEHATPSGDARFRSALPDLTDNVQVGTGTAFGGPFLDFYYLSSGHLVATRYLSTGIPTLCDVLRPSTSVAVQWSFVSSGAVHNIHRENSSGVPLSAGSWTVVSNDVSKFDYSASYVVAGTNQIIEAEAWDGVPFSGATGLVGSPHNVSFFPDGRALAYRLFDGPSNLLYFVIADPFDDDGVVVGHVGDCAAVDNPLLQNIFPFWPEV